MVLCFKLKGHFDFNCYGKTMRNSSIDHEIVAVGPYRKCQRLSRVVSGFVKSLSLLLNRRMQEETFGIQAFVACVEGVERGRG